VSQELHVHRWQVPEHHAAVAGPGSPLEIGEEDVLGVPTVVFKHRPPHLRAVFESAVERFGDNPYFVFPDQTLTYRDAAASVARIARYLADEHGVGHGDRVGFAAANVKAYPVAWWSTVVLGAVVSGFNGWWTPSELQHGVALTKPKVILGDERRLELLHEAGIPADVPLVDLAELEALIGPPRDDDPALPDTPIAEDDPVLILFTSGTTGRAKGATLSHRILVHAPMAQMMQGATALPPNTPPPPARGPSASLLVTPLFHVSGGVPLVSAPVFGNYIVFPPLGAWSEETHLRLTQEHRIGGWSGVPTQFWRLLESPLFDQYDTSSVMQIGGGGAVFAPELFKLMKQRLPQARVGCGYGMSETFGSGTRLGGVTLDTHPASVGQVEPLCEVQIRDDDDQPVADGEVGEICIRGPVVFLGYWDNAEANAKALDEQRWYRTGDFGRWHDGVLQLESRMRDMIIRGGENIYPIEIENRLVEHPEIADACVVGVDHQQLGQEVAAVLVLHEGSKLTADEVKAWVGEALAKYKVPQYVLHRDALPYNQTGKVIKHEVEQDVKAELA
jgi:acyl-CoA synthetase (AMP-forming)/AMP-acid ligase II